MPRRRFPAVDALRLALLVLSFSLNPSAWAEEGLEKRSFEVSGFSAVVLRIPAELFLTQDGTETLVAEAEPRVLARLTVEVRNGTLYIDADEGGFQTRRPIRLQLSVKALHHLQLDSSGDIQAGPLRSEKLRIVLQGSGTIEVKELVAETLRVELLGSGYVNVTEGRIRGQAILLKGSGDYKASHLQSRHARVSLQGSGSAHLMASEHLQAEISGSGDIVYSGRPRLSESVTGAGAVVPSGEN